MFAPTFIVDARRPEQAEIKCYLHAQMAYRHAVAIGAEWIRVEKPGHTSDFMVAALREQMRSNPQAVPLCLVNASRSEHLALGATFDSYTRNWPGVALTSLGQGG